MLLTRILAVKKPMQEAACLCVALTLAESTLSGQLITASKQPRSRNRCLIAHKYPRLIMAEETDDLALARDLDDAARADLQQRIADQLEKILEAECDAVLAEYATVLVATEKKSMAEMTFDPRTALAEMIEEERAARFRSTLGSPRSCRGSRRRSGRGTRTTPRTTPRRRGRARSSRGRACLPGRGFRGRGARRGRGRAKGRAQARRGRGRGKAGAAGRAPAAAEARIESETHGSNCWGRRAHHHPVLRDLTRRGAERARAAPINWSRKTYVNGEAWVEVRDARHKVHVEHSLNGRRGPGDAARLGQDARRRATSAGRQPRGAVVPGVVAPCLTLSCRSPSPRAPRARTTRARPRSRRPRPRSTRRRASVWPRA